MALVYYVTFAHMVGGIMIALGILTRFSSIIQIPIVLGAVFVNDSLLSPINAQLWYSVIALALLVVFIIIGSGPFSLDRYFGKPVKLKKNRNKYMLIIKPLQAALYFLAAFWVFST